MKIDFNNLRKQTAYALDNVIKTLNSGILNETAYHFDEGIGGAKGKQVEGDLLIQKDKLQKDIDWLRSNVWTLLCCFEKDNPDYVAVYEDVEKSGGLARFNDEEKEDN